MGARDGVLVRDLARQDADAAASLWRRCCRPEGDLVYKPFSATEFVATFLDQFDGYRKASVVAERDGSVVGFANGTVKDGGEQGYVTAVTVGREFRRRGIGRRLLGELEDRLSAASGTTIDRFEVLFFNPITLTWIIPGTDGHDHPNSPGVDVACDGYLFLKNMGYRDFAYQNSYYLRLSDYEYPADIQERIDRLAAEGIGITRLDPQRHTGLDELFDDLGNQEWREIIMGNIAAGGPGDPVLIVEDGDRACGFTGPLGVQESGRGYFAGIGVHSDYRGRGAGTALFAALCMGLRDVGATFMSLFTGEANPARNIYEAAGFKIVRSWVNMRKTIDPARKEKRK